ncbi:endonuclease/Exonuclease/phosphatase family protein [Mycobacterium ulcerans str. Harvey]|uniref:Endonuclease/Exonuclease/phosphatase family protein n=1 Tax=Mycobacterium ulcerans str. Harvey TaxID=1299332 RepID=A0ABP3A2P7_MYCUL|nr:endonuclease/Exonuclease/phosphatase family protein [Mycobacterium ulcerans str. Harvey]
MTANRRLDLLNPQFPAHKPANQQRRSPGVLTNANLRQLANYILQNSAGRAVIVTGDFNALYSEDQPACSTSPVPPAHRRLGGGRARPTTPTFAPDCMVGNECELLDKIFYRSGTGVTLQAPPTAMRRPTSTIPTGKRCRHSLGGCLHYETTNVSYPN